jgi:hypothetical protein
LTLVHAAKKQPPRDRIVRDSILCASLFLTHARFENFFKDIVSFAITILNGRALSSKSLPGRLRAAHLVGQIPHPSLKHYYVYDNERVLLDSLHDGFSRGDWAWASELHKGSLDPSIILGSKGYPSSENLKSVFYKLGVENIFAECSRRMRTDVAVLIDGIGDLRCEMAHLGLPSQITDDDIEKKIKDLARTAETIDRIVHDQFRKPTIASTRTLRHRRPSRG